LKVTWHPDAPRRAVENAAAVVTHGSPDDVYELAGGRLTWTDLACLVDMGRALLAEHDGPAADG
jgi:hypothetical protein